MDVLLVLLRLLHIVSAFAWVGLSVAVTFYVAPAALKAGESGLRFLKTLLTRTNFGSIFAIVSGLTTLAGILLYLFGNSMAHFSQTGNIVLGIGAVAGLLATIHGGAVVGRSTRALGTALVQQVPETGPIASDVQRTLTDLAATLLGHARLSMVLMVIALVCMGSARYL
ncbi:MAG: hypothetical protein K8J31_28205 [Anaerolineae bacterium]|jgi:uncharacterized membrane protein|nr:hypothetical protein [Anaerolineae bacterium]